MHEIQIYTHTQIQYTLTHYNKATDATRLNAQCAMLHVTLYGVCVIWVRAVKCHIQLTMIVLYAIADTSFPFDLFPMVFAAGLLLLPCHIYRLLPFCFSVDFLVFTISITIRVSNGWWIVWSILVWHGMSGGAFAVRATRTVKTIHFVVDFSNATDYVHCMQSSKRMHLYYSQRGDKFRIFFVYTVSSTRNVRTRGWKEGFENKKATGQTLYIDKLPYIAFLIYSSN